VAPAGSAELNGIEAEGLVMATIEISGIRVVVFDLDDTLYPERSYAFSGFEAVGQWLTERYECGFSPAGRMRELFDTPHRPRVFDEVLNQLGIEPKPELIQTLVNVYREHRPTITLFPDAEQALKRWAGPFRLGLISDGPLITQQRKVEALALAGRIERIILTDAWGQAFWKPHPRAFQEIETAFDRRESACIYLADNPAKDFVTPRKRGWRTARIRRNSSIYCDAIPPHGSEAEFDVACLDDLVLSS
jgi:putative hydrolase of the HAD superfamily